MTYLRASRRDREVLSLVVQEALSLKTKEMEHLAELIGQAIARRL